MIIKILEKHALALVIFIFQKKLKIKIYAYIINMIHAVLGSVQKY
jgi:hypothetical protein